MTIKKICGFLTIGVLASCTSTTSLRHPASSADILTVNEQQILSKSAADLADKAQKMPTHKFELTATEKALVPEIEVKLKKILHHPFGIHTYQHSPLAESVDRSAGEMELRITSWNIERGQEFDQIMNFFSMGNNGKCDRIKAINNLNWKDRNHTETLDEICALNETDVLLLNEVDFGVCRSGYKMVASEIAQRLNMNYVYAPSFFEAEPSKNGLVPSEDSYCVKENLALMKNLTGNALLSRYPLSHVQVIPLPVGFLTKDGAPASEAKNDTYCYDWHDDEAKNTSLLDKGVRVGAKVIFKENISRELRYGSRNAIVADVTLPSGAVVTVVTAHLENKAKPSCRQAQMRYLLSHVQTSHPLVIGGDMNTTGADGGRLGLKTTAWDLSLKQTVMNQNFWLGLFGLSNPVTAALGYGKMLFKKVTTMQNPTRTDIKWLRANPEGALFSYMKDHGFVWEGEAKYSLSGKNEGPWSTTNARDRVGFEGTHYLNRTFGTEGVSKLDWFFVNTYGDQCAHAKFPRTLGRLRSQLADNEFPSDHIPITLVLETPCL